MPVIGHVDEISRYRVAGWAMDTDDPATPVEIQILVPGVRRVSVRADKFRDDLKTNLVRHHPGATGQHGFAFELYPPIPIYVTRDVTVTALRSGDVLKNGKRTLYGLGQHPLGQRLLSPVMLTSTGRAGTTLLMSRLTNHPELVTTPTYPYEQKLLSYYATVFRTLTATADRAQSSNPDNLRSNRFFVGFNPFNIPPYSDVVRDPSVMEVFYEDSVPRHLAAAFCNIVRDHYELVRADQGKTDARFFVEKNDIDFDSRRAPRVFFETVREIIMVRDPRDVVCSSKAFWKHDEKQSLISLGNTMADLRTVRGERRSDVLFIKYEEFVVDEPFVLAKIASFLGLVAPFTPARDGDATLFRSHGTSQTPVASIGRWKTELSEETIAACNDVFGSFLDDFGYQR
jgi:hypothetical protein